MPVSNSRAVLAYLFEIAVFLNILNFKQDNHYEFALISSLSLSFPRHKKQIDLDFTQTLKKQLEIHFSAICNHDRCLSSQYQSRLSFWHFFSKLYLILSLEMEYQAAFCQFPNNSFTVEVKCFLCFSGKPIQHLLS